MVGEFGGIGAFIPGREWAPGGCFAYLPNPDARNESATYVEMAAVLLAQKRVVSVSVFTQITDVENECDGFYTMDRVTKFTADETAAIVAANQQLIGGACPQGWLSPLNGFLADGGDAIPPAPADSVDAAKATCEATPSCECPNALLRARARAQAHLRALTINLAPSSRPTLRRRRHYLYGQPSRAAQARLL
jgi:hypothetical protein